MTSLRITISDNMYRQLQELCDRQHQSLEDTVRELIRRRLAVERFRRLRRKGLPFAEAQGILTDEDVFEAIP